MLQKRRYNMSAIIHNRIIKNSLVILLAAVMIVTTVAPASFAASKGSSKSKEYVTLSFAPQKIGNYYYKLTGDRKVVRSRNKYSGYKKVMKEMTLGPCMNSKYIYYVVSDWENSRSILKRYTISSGNTKSLKKLPFSEEGLNQYYVNAVYNGNVYIHGYLDGARAFRYNIKSGKLKKMPANIDIFDRSGPYVLTSDYLNQVSKCNIRKITSSGKLKKKKTLFTRLEGDMYYNEFRGEFVGKKLYYAITDVQMYEDADGDDMNETENTIHFYCCNRDGSKVEKLGTLNIADVCECVVFTSKYCDISRYDWSDDTDVDGVYRYYFKTGKLKKLSDKYCKKNYYYFGWE